MENESHALISSEAKLKQVIQTIEEEIKINNNSTGLSSEENAVFCEISTIMQQSLKESKEQIHELMISTVKEKIDKKEEENKRRKETVKQIRDLMEEKNFLQAYRLLPEDRKTFHTQYFADSPKEVYTQMFNEFKSKMLTILGTQPILQPKIETGSSVFSLRESYHMLDTLSTGDFSKTSILKLESWCDLNDECAIQALKIVANNPTIRGVYLFGQSLGNECVIEAAKMIENKDNLKWIYIMGQEITNKSLRELANSCKQCKNLERLYIGGDEIGDEGAIEIKLLLMDNRSIVSLYLNSSTLTGIGLSHILGGLYTNKIMKRLYILGQFKEIEIKNAIEFLHKKTTINKISICSTLLSESQCKELKKKLAFLTGSLLIDCDKDLNFSKDFEKKEIESAFQEAQTTSNKIISHHPTISEKIHFLELRKKKGTKKAAKELNIQREVANKWIRKESELQKFGISYLDMLMNKIKQQFYQNNISEDLSTRQKDFSGNGGSDQKIRRCVRVKNQITNIINLAMQGENQIKQRAVPLFSVKRINIDSEYSSNELHIIKRKLQFFQKIQNKQWLKEV